MQADEDYQLYLSLYLNHYGLSDKQANLLASHAMQRDHQVQRVKDDYDYEISRIPVRWFRRVEAAQNTKREMMKATYSRYNEIIDRKLKEFGYAKNSLVGDTPPAPNRTGEEPESSWL